MEFKKPIFFIVLGIFNLIISNALAREATSESQKVNAILEAYVARHPEIDFMGEGLILSSSGSQSDFEDLNAAEAKAIRPKGFGKELRPLAGR